MTRGEEINQAEQNYIVNTPISDWFSASGKSFRNGVLWADQHPRKGLWDSEKVVKWILENADKHIWYDEMENECGITDNFIEDLQKAMEE